MAKAPRYGVPDEENPEWTEEDFARARPFKNVFPEQFASWQNKRIGRPPSSNPKVHISFRLASDLVDGIKATGEGYNARVEKVLRNALKRGALNEPRAPKDILVKFGDIGNVTLKRPGGVSPRGCHPERTPRRRHTRIRDGGSS